MAHRSVTRRRPAGERTTKRNTCEDQDSPIFGSTREHVVRPVGMGAGKVLQPGDGRRRVQTWLLSAG